MKAEIKFSGIVETLKLCPGDKVVITAPGHIPLELAERLTKALKPHFPDNEVLVIGDGLKLSVVQK